MKRTFSTSSAFNRLALSSVALLIAVNSGCSMLLPKDDTASSAQAPAAFTKNISTDRNETPLPVEINNDIGKIVGGVPLYEGGGGAGRVNVNVNVNFNGASGWSKTVSESVSPSGDINKEVALGAPASQAAAAPAAAGAVAGVVESGAPRVPAAADAPAVPAPTSSASVGGKGQAKTYVVKPGDTLMKISFEQYGSVYRWREILRDNKGRIADYSALTAGTSLTINGVDYVVIERNGSPYLIKWRDTLGKISRKVYGTNRFWRELWKNNPQLIRNPNKIYAGFTLYYRDPSALKTPISTARDFNRQVSPPRELPEKRTPANSAGSGR